MATRILVFNPLTDTDVERAEKELDHLLLDGYEIIASVGGNRAHIVSATEPESHPPTVEDYVVLILRRK